MEIMFKTTKILCLLIAGALFPVLAGAATAGDGAEAGSTGGAIPVISLRGEGMQIYECKADPANGNLYVWTFREPLAILVDKDGKTVGRHFAGPSWQLDEGGTITGKVEVKTPGASEKDIPALKLSVVSRQGKGVLTEATVVQRLDTHGGAFSGSCATPGALHLEPYTAQYVFSRN